VLRSFSVVGALAAAALALVIGVLAFNAHSNKHNAPPGGGPGESGVASHPVSAQSNPRQQGSLLDLEPAQGYAGERRPQPGTNGSTHFYSSSSGSTATQQVRLGGGSTCSPGLVSGLLAAIGGLLGGGGSAC
jgi:hypothetical protein